jgi:hypothetical protein
MRTGILLIAMMTAVVSACTTNKIEDYIPGTYVDSASSEYSIAFDTLIIEPAEIESQNYIIHRKTGFRRIENGKLGKYQFKAEEWVAVFDPDTKVLNEITTGKTITFYPQTKRLRVVRREYQKID